MVYSPTDYLVSFTFALIVCTGMGVIFCVSAIRLCYKLYYKRFNYIFLELSFGMKLAATISIWGYTIFYILLSAALLTVIVITAFEDINDISKTKGATVTALTYGIIGFICYDLGIVCYHFYCLLRIDHHIKTFEEVMPMPFYNKYKIWYITFVLLILLFIDIFLWAFTRSSIFGYTYTVDKVSATLTIIGLIIEFCSGLSLLIIYIHSFHILSKWYFRSNYKYNINDRQHELMLRASRFTVVCSISIIITFIIYIIMAITYVTHWKPEYDIIGTVIFVFMLTPP